MNEKEFLAKWSVEKSLHEAWAQFIKNKMGQKIKRNEGTGNQPFLRNGALGRAM